MLMSFLVNSHDQGTEEDSENPALVVVPGSSTSMSGVSQYLDFISCLPGHLSKRILGTSASGCIRSLSKVVKTNQTCRFRGGVLSSIRSVGQTDPETLPEGFSNVAAPCKGNPTGSQTQKRFSGANESNDEGETFIKYHICLKILQFMKHIEDKVRYLGKFILVPLMNLFLFCFRNSPGSR